jgi:uncharacterized protein
MNLGLAVLLLWTAADVVDPDGSTPLHHAVQLDDVAGAKKLLQHVKTANRYGVTPLTLACINGSKPMVDLLLSAGADPNTALPGGETVLMTAARTGRLGAVQSLIAAGAKLDARETVSGQTALMWASAEGNVETVDALLAAGADAFLFAVREGRIPVTKRLLRAGIPANHQIQLPDGKRPKNGKSPRSGVSAMILAVTNGHYELASVLLDAGADPNSADAGYTALHAISHTRKPGGGDNDPPPQGSGSMTSNELVRKLAAKGADLNVRMTKRVGFGMTSLNTIGATPYLLAAKTADAELMRLFVELGADPKIPNADGSTALMAAAGLGTRSPREDAGTETEVLEALQVALNHGADINAVDNNGETALHGAAYKNYPKAVEFLVSRGAKHEVWNRKNKFGWTPLTIAEGYRFGNYKPSAVTVAAFHKIMTGLGLSIASDPTARNR